MPGSASSNPRLKGSDLFEAQYWHHEERGAFFILTGG